MEKFDELKDSMLYQVLVNENIELRLPLLHKEVQNHSNIILKKYRLLFDDVILKMMDEDYTLAWRIDLKFKYHFLDDEGDVGFLGGVILFEREDQDNYLFYPGKMYNGMNLRQEFTSGKYGCNINQFDKLYTDRLLQKTIFLEIFHENFFKECDIFFTRLIKKYEEGIIGTDCPAEIMESLLDN